MSFLSPSKTSPAPRAAGDPRGDDLDADRKTFAWVAAFLVAGLVVDILSSATEISRENSAFPIEKIIIYEATGFGVFLALFPLIAWFASRATPGQHNWRFVIPFHLGASVVVSLLHVAIMVAIRKLIFLAVYPEPYIFTDNFLRDFIYEYRKGVLAYAVVLFCIVFGRQLFQQCRELNAACEDAVQTKRITLKCGGRSIWIEASDVSWVKSASNYAEVTANGKTYLARATLSSIERQLTDAGAPAARVHRSYVANTDHIKEIRPTGEGDVKIEMRDGAVIPGSRRYRDRLPRAD